MLRRECDGASRESAFFDAGHFLMVLGGCSLRIEFRDELRRSHDSNPILRLKRFAPSTSDEALLVQRHEHVTPFPDVHADDLGVSPLSALPGTQPIHKIRIGECAIGDDLKGASEAVFVNRATVGTDTVGASSIGGVLLYLAQRREMHREGGATGFLGGD